ncbi:MAG: efflux RND transporter permease subunit, partial [Pseudomonadota bacterium]
PALRADLDAFGTGAFPEGEFRTERLVFGPGGGAPVEARFSGPDPVVLRQLANQALARMAEASANVLHLRTDWREQELVVAPVYATDRAQTAGISRDDVANTLAFATDGIRAGVYREDERLIPITVRLPRESGLSLRDQVVYSDSVAAFVPIEQVVEEFDVTVEDTLIHRLDRVSTITVAADKPASMTAAELHAEVRATIEEMSLPPGYKMEWGGEFESSGDANESLGQQLPVSILVMVLISVLLFNAIRQPIIIWLLVPMSVNGVSLGLLGTGLPFTFTALLGLLSLSGMLIKNGIVLVDEIDQVRTEGNPLRDAIVSASVSRLRPVILAAATTILGMIPLLSDAFFVSMAVTIMGGLAFASILTLVAAPVFYYVFFAPGERRASAA